MIMTFDEMKANARANYKSTPRVEFVEPKNYDRVNYISQVVGLAIATTLFVVSIIF